MKMKLVTAAIALAVSGNAAAGIVSSLENNGGGGGLGEAVFSIWDPTTNQSYSQDLGTTWQTFRDNLDNTSFSASYAVDAAIYNLAVGGSDTANLIWNVSAANAQNADFSNFEDFGVIGTSNIGNVLNTAALDTAIVHHSDFATVLRPLGDQDPAANVAYFGTIANGGYAGSEFVWSTSWATNGATNNTASFGTDLDFYYWQTGGFSPDPVVSQAVGSWSFDGTDLSYAAPSTVPVPAAAWLFGSGLLGLVGIARRKSVQA